MILSGYLRMAAALSGLSLGVTPDGGTVRVSRRRTKQAGQPFYFVEPALLPPAPPKAKGKRAKRRARGKAKANRKALAQ